MKNRLALFLLAILLTAVSPLGANAQDDTGLPALPAPIQNLVNEGAQVRFLGKDYGLESWVSIKNGQEQYFYVLPDQKAFLMGVLFNNEGKLVTVDQVRRLQEQGDSLLDTLADDQFAGMVRNPDAQDTSFEFKTPGEQLFYDVENSNWVPLGQPGAPVAYAFIDPQCPHCHDFITELKEPYLMKGRVQLRMVPVGFKDETRAQAAFLMAAPNPQERWYAHMGGDQKALPAKSEINQQGVQRNLAIMQSWEFNVTPMVIYRGKDGTVKIIRGNPKDIDNFVNDLASVQPAG